MLSKVAENPPEIASVLHIADGDCRADELHAQGFAGTIGIYGDLLYEGPIPAGLTRAEFIRFRARFMADAGYTTFDEALAYYRFHEATLESARKHAETVLWFDHRFSNQPMLIRVLEWFGQNPELKVRFAIGTPVTTARCALASKAWQAVTTQDPAAIEAFLQTDTTALPHLIPALRRHLEVFP